MIVFEEYIGKKFGKLTITALDGLKKNGTPIFAVDCECGNTYLKCGLDRLESGKTKDCGCSKRNIEMIGKRFGRLLVVEKTEQRKRRSVVWKCQCDCGNICFTETRRLFEGVKTSCGCANKKHNHFAIGSSIYCIWHTMISRCYDTNRKEYYLYGGRGIKVCKEWRDVFANFYDWSISHGYKNERLLNGKSKYTIDRIDPDGDYCPQNCRWITIQEQAKNRRADKLFTYNSETKTIKQWLKQYFVKCQDYYTLLRMGYDNKFILDFISSVDKEKLLVIYNTPKGTIVNDVLAEYLLTLKID